MKKLPALLTLLVFATQAFGAAKLQNEDFKTETDLTNAGSTAAHLLNDTKVYVTANSLNKKLSNAIADGDIGGGGGNGKNFLLNASFENTTVTTSWTQANSTATGEATIITDGAQSIKLALSSQTGDLLQQNPTPAVQLSGVNLQASCFVNTTLTTIQLCAQQAGSEYACSAVPSTGTWTPVIVNMAGPSSGTIGVKIKATSSSTGNVYVDQCYVGKTNTIGTNISVSSFISYTPTLTNFGTSPTSLNFQYRRVGDSMEILGYFVTGSSIPGSIASISLPSPYVIDTAKLALGNTTSGSGHNVGTYAASDPTSQHGAIVTATGTSTSSLYFGSFDGTTSNTGLTARNGNVLASSVPFSFSAIVPISGWTAETAYRPEQASAAFASATHGTDCVWTTTSTSFANPSDDATCTFTQTVNKNITLSSVGSVSPAITWTPDRLRDYYVCATVATNNNSSAGASFIQIVDGSNTALKGDNASGMLDPGGNTHAQQHSCGVISATSLSALTVKVQLATYSGAQTARIQTPNSGTNLVLPIQWMVTALSSYQGVPLLIGSVTSSSSGLERLERVSVQSQCTSDPCTLTSNTPGITTVHQGLDGTGTYRITFATGTFSAAPSCAISGTQGQVAAQNPNVQTSTIYYFKTFSTAGSAANAAFDAICMGPK